MALTRYAREIGTIPTIIALIGPTLLAGTALSQVNTLPAARQHVKMVDGKPTKFTSRLARVVELNFTIGFHHSDGKPIIAASLDRIARTYGSGGRDAFAVRHITSGTNGSSGGVPDFNLVDLLSSEVIVANNVGSFGGTSLGAAKRDAIQRAIETEGRGYLGIHGSGQYEVKGWPWFANQLHPLDFQGHGARGLAPVYKHPGERLHIVLEGILDSNTQAASVPDENDPAGAANLPTRRMRGEWARWGRDITRDSAYADRVTVLLKYDPRNLDDFAFNPRFLRAGGNLYAHLLRVGKGMTSYFLGGHANDELLDRAPPG